MVWQRLDLKNDFQRNCSSSVLCDVWLIVVEIEEVPVQILNRELPQPPRLFLQGFHDVRTRRFQFLVRRINIFGEHPVNRRFEGRLPLAKEDNRVVARHGPDPLARVEPSDLKTERIPVVLLRAFDIGHRQFRHWPAN